MSPLLTDDRFHAFSNQHYLIMAITGVGAAGFIVWGRHHRNTPQEVIIRRAFAVTSLTVILAWQAYLLTPDVISVRSSWPLGLSDLADYTAVFALWTRGERSSAFTYYVGLTFTMFAVVTPALTEPFPTVHWWAFWIRHIDVVWAAVYLIWGLGIRPTWRLYRFTVGAVLIWAAFTLTFNKAMGTNYGYLVDTPSTASPLDWLGPWPWYVVGAMALVIGAWALLFTLPWERAKAEVAERHADTPA